MGTWEVRIRRSLLLVAVLIGLFLAALAGLFMIGYREHWVGAYDLAVHLDTTGEPPRAVSCQVYGHRESAEGHCELSPGFSRRPDPNVILADPFDGDEW